MPKINFYVSGNDFIPDDIKTFKIGLVIPLNLNNNHCLLGQNNLLYI